MKRHRFVESQEKVFEALKRSHIGSAATLCGRFADAQESRIQSANRSKIGSATLPVFNLLMLGNRFFRLRNV